MSSAWSFTSGFFAPRIFLSSIGISTWPWAVLRMIFDLLRAALEFAPCAMAIAAVVHNDSRGGVHIADYVNNPRLGNHHRVARRNAHVRRHIFLGVVGEMHCLNFLGLIAVTDSDYLSGLGSGAAGQGQHIKQ